MRKRPAPAPQEQPALSPALVVSGLVASTKTNLGKVALRNIMEAAKEPNWEPLPELVSRDGRQPHAKWRCSRGLSCPAEIRWLTAIVADEGFKVHSSSAGPDLWVKKLTSATLVLALPPLVSKAS